jgi:hypothetical protein
MTHLDFDSVAKTAVKGSGILNDALIATLLRDNNREPLERYLYRVAAHAVGELRRAENCWRDDSDYIDAFHECSLYFAQILNKTVEHKLSTYAWKVCLRTAKRYLALQERGGMAGDARDFDDIPATESLEKFNPPDDSDGGEPEDTWDDYTCYGQAPAGYGDPMYELINQEVASEAIEHALTRTQDKAMSNRLRAEIGSKNNLL